MATPRERGPDGRREAGERERAARVAASVARAAAEAGVALDDGLLIWSLSGSRPAVGTAAVAAGADRAAGVEAADVLGVALESATDHARRRAQGLHVTPRWLADHLVALALPAVEPAPAGAAGLPAAATAGSTDARPTLCDPACGGGAFLLAAARRLHRAGAERRDVVRHLLWGADIDPVGLAAAEAALALWAGEPPPPGRLVVADPLGSGGGVWPDAPPGGFGAVVGNPPFQSQLGRATARSAAARRRLAERYGGAVRPYTDTAWLFLLLGCELARAGGRVVLVQPDSVVAARDARAVRAAVDRRAVLRDLWVDDGRVFSAAVRVCAPVFERRGEPGPAVSAPPQDGDRGGAEADGERWSRLWARAVDLPVVRLATSRVLGERAAVLAGFRDQYYGLVGAVREVDPADPPEAVVPLVTSGAIDWGACGWGRRPVRFAKRGWNAPVVDLARLARDATPAARRWVERARAPKLVVATQTRVVEAAVDTGGTWVPSVPALAVVPTDAGDLWRLAAAVLSPAATGWLARRAAGTGLGRGSLKVAGPDLAALPLPVDDIAWQAAADALEAHVAAPGPASLDAYLDAVRRAYGTPDALSDWWRRRARTVVHHGSPGG